MKKNKLKTNAKVNLITDYYKINTTQSAGIVVKDVFPQTKTIEVSGDCAEVYSHAEPIVNHSIATDPKYYHLFFS